MRFNSKRREHDQSGAHNYFMEIKEHVFFVILLLGIFLPIAALIVLMGFFVEGAGGIIGKSVIFGLMGR